MSRVRRTRSDLRELLLESALVEFAAKGFDGASTTSIAHRVDAHQPQINYHFDSKQALWTAAVDHLFALLHADLGDLTPATTSSADDPIALGEATADLIRRFVRFAAAHPELNRIMVHEGTEDGPRLRYLVETHVQPIYELIRTTWERLPRRASPRRSTQRWSTT